MDIEIDIIITEVYSISYNTWGILINLFIPKLISYLEWRTYFLFCNMRKE